MSRVILGIVTGIGFICAGTIIKGNNTSDLRGLTVDCVGLVDGGAPDENQVRPSGFSVVGQRSKQGGGRG